MSQHMRTASGKPSPGGGTAPPIMLLENSPYYFLHSVFITPEAEQYRLIAALRDRRVFDGKFKTLQGARTAFTRMYRQRAYKPEEVAAQWTPEYCPEQSWFAEKVSFPLKPLTKQERGIK